MSKYDFELDLSGRTSTGMILNRIKKGSTVLEFGCAAGRMTRYMKETLDCQVYIVEYDRGAFEKALEFAKDGICDDIQTFSWVERFAGITFDAIIFADVLEHLTQPEQTLEKAASLLKEDGCVLVSVPNVTHNDIVLKMFEERFDYTQTGLLDDTHVHFWGLENIKLLGREAGFSVRKVEGTPCSAGNTEQKVQLGKNILLENILRRRQAGETYQFVVTLDKSGCEATECSVSAPDLYSHLYLDTGKDFNQEECIPLTASYTGSGYYVVNHVVENIGNLCRVRLDPVEHQGVFLRSISICQSGIELPLVMPNEVWSAEGVYLLGDDPMVIAQIQPGQGPVVIEAEFALPGEEYLRILEQTARIKQEKLTEQDIQINCYGNEVASLRASVTTLQGDLSRLQDEKKQLERRNTMLDQKIAEQAQLCAQLQMDVGAYSCLVNQKEKLIIGQENRIISQENRIISLEQELCALKATFMYKLLVYYWKIRAFAGRVKRKLKRFIKKFLGRAS